MSGYEFGKSVLENLKAMSEQRDIADVAKECDVAFNQGSGEIHGLKVITAKDPLKAAIDYASEVSGVVCLVVEHSWFGTVPSRKTDLKGWLNSLKVWDSIDEQRRIQANR